MTTTQHSHSSDRRRGAALAVAAIMGVGGPTLTVLPALADQPPVPAAAGRVRAAEKAAPVARVTQAPAVSVQGLGSSTVRVSQLPLRSVARGSMRCVRVEARGEYKHISGLWVIGTYWLEGRWCFDGKRVRRTAVLSADGETSSWGWSFEGATTRAARVRNRAHIVGKFVFKYSANPLSKPATMCLRIKGRPNGRFDVDGNCSLYA